MNVRRVRGMMVGGNLLAVALALAAGWGAQFAPLPEPPVIQDQGRTAVSALPATTTAVKAISLQEWEPDWTQPLRRPLVDLAPTVAAVTPTVAPPKASLRPKLNLRVVGTIQEEGKTIALLQVGMGEVQLCKPGDTVNGAGECRVVEIAGNTVRLRHLDQDVVLELRLDRPKD